MRGKRKRTRAAAVMLCIALLLSAAACSDKNSNSKSGAGAPAKESAVKLKVGMAGKDIKTVCVILAKELGYYEEEGLDVEFETVATLNDGVTALSMNKLDVLPYGFVPSAAFISQGARVFIIGGTIAEGSQAITTEKSKDSINSPADFAGKKVGFIRPETGQMIMKSLIRKEGLEIGRDVEFIPMDGAPAIAEAISKGELDVGFVNSGYGYVAQQMGLATALDVGDFAPGAVCCRQTASEDAVKNKRAALVSFEIANLRAYEVYLKDREKTVALLMDYSGQDEDYVTACMYNGVMIPTMDPSLQRIEELYEVMKENGDIDKDTACDIKDFVDSSIYKSALDEMQKRYPKKELYQKLLAEYEENN